MAYYSAGYGYNPTTAYISVKKLWDSMLHHQVQQSLFFKDMIGRDNGEEDSKEFTNYPIVEKTQLGKDSGDRITMSLVRQLNTSTTYNAGKTGVTQLVDSENTMSFYNTYVNISHWRDAVAIFGKMTLQRTPFDVRSVAKDLLAKEIAQFLDKGLFFALYCGYSPNVVREVGTSALLEKLPLNNVYGKDKSALTGVDVNDVVDTDLMERLSVAFVENNMNPIRFEGEECGLFIVHPRGFKSLRSDSLYQDANINGMPRSKDNPMFSRAKGKWANIYIAEHNQIDSAKNYGSLTVSQDAITIAAYTAGSDTASGMAVTDIRMNLLLGANAVARAVALPSYMAARKEDDYGNLIGFGGGLIYGDRRADWEIDDGSGGTFKNQSSICVWTYSPAVNSNLTAIWS